MAVIAIGQQLGARGSELGRRAAQRLGCGFFGFEENAQATTQRYGIPREHIDLIDERQPRFWERLTTDVSRVLVCFRAVTLSAMSSGDAVVVGRAIPLLAPANAVQILRLRVVAPFEERVRNIMTEEQLDQAAAERRVRHFDQEAPSRIQQLLKQDLHEPTHYDMTLNTGRLSLECHVAALADYAATIDRGTDAAARQLLADGCLVAQVQAALMMNPRVGHAPVVVTARAGVVSLRSPALVPPWDQLALSIVNGVAGVSAVELEIEEPPVPLRTD